MSKERFRKQIADCTCLVTKRYEGIEEHLYVSPVALVYDVVIVEEKGRHYSRRCPMVHALVPLSRGTAQFLIQKIKGLPAKEAFDYLKRILNENWKAGKVCNESFRILPYR